MEHEHIKPPAHTVNEAMQHIESLRSVIAPQGNVDHEMGTLTQIQQQLQAGDITPTEAMTKATAVEQDRILR